MLGSIEKFPFLAHPSCVEISEEMLAVVLTYKWMCMECKVCVKCKDPGNEVSLLYQLLALRLVKVCLSSG